MEEIDHGGEHNGKSCVNANHDAMNFENHRDLVDVIRGVHSKLRKAFHLTGNVDEVWQDHVADEDLRKKYSNAMFKLATKIWEQKESRISWTYNTCVDYFQNGGIEKSLLRELKIKQKWAPEQMKELECLIYLSNQENNYKNTDRKLKLLDVGSCYNPFSRFSMFSCIAIDLTPATEDVMQCDFLTVELKSQDYRESNVSSNVIFCEESFDVVVFSLVLEYLPAADQRMKFCMNAWKLLQQNGLLIIITPDSKSLQHNVTMMKSWKKAIENIGFIRIKYDKLTHMHCMAFRKICSSLSQEEAKSMSNLLFIPQDFKTYDPTIESSERTQHENHNVYQKFSELPNENVF